MKLATAFLLLWCAACAHQMAPGEAPADRAAEQDRSDAAELDRRAADLDRALSSLALEQNAPDCKRVCELSGQICELGRRICVIAERHAGDADLANRCVVAKERCDRSSERASARCACAR